MSRWPGKYVIGLTGNIATGKSAVRTMLEELGAYGIDADALAHRVIARGAPGYARVVESFGERILNGDGQINRTRLGRIVFGDPEALRRLEEIVHPLVRQEVDLLVRGAHQPVVVIEAIKLLESPLAREADAVWVTDAPPALQVERLMSSRSMSEAEALRRIASQNPQSEKVKVADVMIDTRGALDQTRRQVQAAWARIPVLV